MPDAIPMLLTPSAQPIAAPAIICLSFITTPFQRR
jgi:hypothetical protein